MAQPLLLKRRQRDGRALTMITCYDYSSARLLKDSGVDLVLVGDSAAMVMHGYDSTLPANLEMMLSHTAAVARAKPPGILVADMPFLSYRRGLIAAVDAAGALMQAGAQAIKLEGARGQLEIVRHLVDSGIPVMGHLGLTPQSVHTLGGYKVQAREDEEARRLMAEAKELASAGCFALVLECIPTSLASAVTEELMIPTIGIGAGPDTDGQVLVWQDLLGLQSEWQPKFVRRYLNGAELIQTALKNYVSDVQAGKFPGEKESYS